MIALLAVASVRAQDTATQQQLDQIRGKLQDLVETQDAQSRRIEALAKELAELRDKVNTPVKNEDNASVTDLKNLAEKVQEIDKKRASDREMILKEIEKVAKIAATPIKVKTPAAPVKTVDDTAASATPQKGYYYVVQEGDTLGAIAKAYKDQGVKVTTSQILAANPGLTPSKLYKNKKIFIPDPNAK